MFLKRLSSFLSAQPPATVEEWVAIDWSGGMPVVGKASAPCAPANPDFANSRRGAVVLEAIRRLRTLLNERG
jgi:hypothetical protein